MQWFIGRDWRIADGLQPIPPVVEAQAPEGGAGEEFCRRGCNETIDLVRRGGTVVLFGVCPIGETIPLEPNSVYFRELTIAGSYVNPFTFQRAIALLRGGVVRVVPLNVRAYPLEGVHDALASLRDGTALKNMIVPGS